jgi:hypothetical protein
MAAEPIINLSPSNCPCGILLTETPYQEWVKVGVDYFGSDIWEQVWKTFTKEECINPCPSPSTSDSCDPAECCKDPIPECIPEECFDGYDPRKGCYGTCEDNMIQCCGQMIKCGQICKIDCEPTDSETDSDTGSSSESVTCECPKCPVGFSETVDNENRRPINIQLDCFDNKKNLCSSKTCYKSNDTDSDTPSTSEDSFSVSDSADCKWQDFDCGDDSSDPIPECFEHCVDFYGVRFTIPAQPVTTITTINCILNGQVVDTRDINCYSCESLPPGCPNPPPSPSQSACPAYDQSMASAELAAAKQSCYFNPSCKGGSVSARGNLVPVGKIPNCYAVQVTCFVTKNCVLPDGNCQVITEKCAQIYNP